MILKILILYSGKNFFEKKSGIYFCIKKYFMNTFPDSGKKIFEKKIKTRIRTLFGCWSLYCIRVKCNVWQWVHHNVYSKACKASCLHLGILRLKTIDISIKTPLRSVFCLSLWSFLYNLSYIICRVFLHFSSKE